MNKKLKLKSETLRKLNKQEMYRGEGADSLEDIYNSIKWSLASLGSLASIAISVAVEISEGVLTSEPSIGPTNCGGASCQSR